MARALVVDANVLASALMGTSLPLLAQIAQSLPIVSPTMQFAETRKVLARRGRSDVDHRMRELHEIVDEVDPTEFAHFETVARQRLQKRGQPDWPVLATALALEAHIWSRDRDFFGVGVPVWDTRNIRYAAREPAETEHNA